MKARVFGIVIAFLLAAACGDDEPSTASDGSLALSDPSSTTSAPTTTTTTASPLTTTTTTARCPGTAGVPPAATSTADASADADGDGTPDVVRTYRLGESWHLVAELSSGGVTEDLSVPGPEVEPGPLRIIGGTNLSGGDERAELLVVQGAGASTQIVVLYQLEGCTLVRVLNPDGGEAGFPVGGGVLQRGLLSCGGFEEEPVNWLFEQSATRSADDHWEVHSFGYAMADDSPPRLVQTFGPQDDVFTDEQMNNRPSVRCDDLSLQ